MKNQAAPAFLVFVASALSLTMPAGTAHAACMTVPNPAPTFRGVVGSIDRPFARPGEGDDIIALGSACNSPPLADVNGDEVIDVLDFNVTIIAKPMRGAGRRALVVRGAGDCASAGPELADLQKALNGQAPDCTAASSMKPSTPPGNLLRPVRLQLPPAEFAGPATIVVTPIGAPLPVGLVDKGCADHEEKDAPLVCIDQLFDGEGRNCGTSPEDVDALFKHFVLLPPVNDFRLLCTHKGDGGSSKTAPQCVGKSDQLYYTVNDGGDVILDMSWAGILRPTAGGYDLRDVLGSSAVGAFEQPGEPIHVPGAAFLKSFNPAGKAFTRQPLFVPVEGVRPNELTLRGDADKGRSVLYLLRRLPWGYACVGGANDGQACEQSPQEYPLVADCPQGACTEQSPDRIFACQGGSRAGAPCTRPRQCPGGECRPGSKCYTENGELAGSPPHTDCESDSECSDGEECGAGLFEFRTRVPNGIGTIPRQAGEKFKGACEDGFLGLFSNGTNCSGTFMSCLFGATDCVVFRTETFAYP